MIINKRKIINLEYCVFSILFGKKRIKANNDVVFIPFFGRLGDMVMFLSTLQELKKLFVNKMRKKIVLGCRKEVWSLLQSINAEQDLCFFELHRENLDISINYFFDRVMAAQKIKPSCILHIRENAVIDDLFIHAIPADEKIIYRSFAIEHEGRASRFFSGNTYTKEMVPHDNMDQLTCYADMMRKLGLKSIKSRIPLLPEVGTINGIIHGKYVCICPGASVENKCWPSERYARVLDYITERLPYQIVFCGGKDDQYISACIIKKMKNSDIVLDMTGKTAIADWIALIRNAEFVLTNESGAVHIAASNQVQAICIGEQKYSDKWLPYRPEEIRENDKIPIVVRGPRLNCEFCAARNFKRDAECIQCYQKNGVIRCVFEVKTEDVIQAVDEVIISLKQK